MKISQIFTGLIASTMLTACLKIKLPLSGNSVITPKQIHNAREERDISPISNAKADKEKNSNDAAVDFVEYSLSSV